MAVGKLFVEIGAKSTISADLQASMQSLENFGVAATASGKRFLASFEAALNPTKALKEQIELLEKAGKPTSEIMMVLGDKIAAATEQARAHGQPISDVVKYYDELGKKSAETGISIETLGQGIMNFAQNPLQAAKNALTGMLQSLGPSAVALGAMGAAAGVATVAVFNFVDGASNAMEHLENLSAQTGLSTQQLQALEQIASEMGLTGLDLGRTIGMLNQQLGSPEMGDFEKACKAMGITLVGVNGETKDAVTLLDEMGANLRAIEDPTIRAQVAQAALGGRLRELIPLLVNSKASIKDMTAEMNRWGIVTSEKTKAGLRAWDEMMDGISRAITATKNTMLSWLNTAADKMADWLHTINPLQLVYKKTTVDIGVALKETTDKGKEYLKNLQNQEKDTKAAEAAAKKLKEEQARLNREFEATVMAVDKLGLSFRDTESTYDVFYASTILVRNIMAELSAQIKKSDDTLRAFSTTARGLPQDLSGAGNNTVAGALSTVNNKLGDFGVEMGKAKTEAGSFGSVLKNQVSTIFTDLSSKLANNILEWGGWAETIKNTFKAFAEAMLRIVFEKLMDPLTKLINKALDSLLDLFTTTSTSVSDVAGGVSKNIGESISSSLSSLGAIIMGGIAAIGGIIGGFISGSMSKGTEISANTRMTYHALVDPAGVIDRLNMINQTMWDAIGGTNVRLEGLIDIGWASIDRLEWINEGINSLHDGMQSLAREIISAMSDSSSASTAGSSAYSTSAVGSSVPATINVALNVDGTRLTSAVIDTVESNRGGSRTALSRALRV